MKNPLPYMFAIGLIIALYLWVNQPVKRKDLPPGYSLLCNDRGQYYPAAIGYDFTVEQPMTRQEAINRAWLQFEYSDRINNNKLTFNPCE
jgi:hypothetical protein